MLFEHIEESYIAALDSTENVKAKDFKEKYKGRILELKNPFKYRILYQIQTYINIVISILYFRFKLHGKVTLIIYGAGTRWLILYPLFRCLRFKILYSERNDGVHKAKILYKIMERCDVLTTNSIEVKEEIEKYVKKKNIYVVNNGTYVPENRLSKHELHSPLMIVVPARIHKIKNQKIVIEALSKYPNVEIHFAGKIDSDSYYMELNNLITPDNRNKFIFDGYIEDMTKYYGSFDLIILPSLSEGTPNVLLEGMAHQIPCIASDISMNRRVIRDARFLFDFNSPQSLYNCVLNFENLSQESITQLIGDNYNYVQSEYSISKMVRTFSELLLSIA